MSAEARRCGILLPPGTEQSLAYKTYMEGCERMEREMTPQERAAALYRALGDGCDLSAPEQEKRDIEAITDALTDTRRAALLEIRQFCVDYEDCCVLGLVAHADKAVTNASISTMQFIKRHIDDRLAQEG